MHFHSSERIGLFIDGPSTFVAQKVLGCDIDYKRLLAMFQEQGRVVRAFYFSSIPDEEEHVATRPLLDWLSYNGFTVITRSIRQDHSHAKRGRATILVDLAVEAMRASDYLDHAALFSGEADYASLICALKDKGKRVSVVSTTSGSPAIVSDEVRKKADQFIELGSILPLVGRKPAQAGPPHD